MIDLYYWTTANGHKITLFLEEAGLAYRMHPINIAKGEQFAPAFLAITPNNKIPAIVDHDPVGGGDPLSLFESAAILTYLADKTGLFMPSDARGRAEVSQWLFWQVGGLAPMAGQYFHFNAQAPEKIPYAIERFFKEATRLYTVLDKHLAGRAFMVGDSYSIADMAIYPWMVSHRNHSQDLADYPGIKRWFDTIATRPATARAYAWIDRIAPLADATPDERQRILSGN